MIQILNEFNWARGLTVDLLKACSQSDLEFCITANSSPLWKQFRHIARVHENYLNALETKKIQFCYDGCSYAGGASKDALLQYFEVNSQRQVLLLKNINNQAEFFIDWFGEKTNLEMHFVRLLSHETLHHGQLIFYWKALSKSFPSSWSAWGE